METLNKLSRWIALPFRSVIWLYQATLSPDHGLLRAFYPHGYCKFYPSCSVYVDEVLKHEGLIGLPKIIKRILTCRPGVAAGVDLPYKHGKHI